MSESQSKEVIIVGAGIAGLAAALAARESGASVTIMEKAADCQANNTSRAGGSFTFAPEMEGKDKRRLSPEEKTQEALRLSKGSCDAALIKTLAQQVEEALNWMGSLGFKWDEKEPAISSRRPVGGGAGICTQLVPLAEKRGCKLLFSTRVSSLLQSDGGQITGVRAVTGEGEKDFPARAVVLATGGFQANSEMRKKYLAPEWAEGVFVTGTSLGEGEGHLMALKSGAQLIGMDNIHAATIDVPTAPGVRRGDPLRQLRLTSRLGIIVNKVGKRFIEEGSTVTAIGASIRKQPQGEAAFLWDERVRQEVLQRTKKDETGEYLQTKPGMIKKLNSLEETASLIGAPAQELRKTAGRFNPPYYVLYPVKAALHSSMGGVKITEGAQVVNQQGKAIPGLFAAGSVSGGFFCGQYQTTEDGMAFYQGNLQVTATSLACCATFGRIAGKEAALFAAR